ncbi:MAG TPA: DUF1501 domain-containing protein [Tepidisphaeraceae bacterium]|jgi:hypothetical protein|nr:DUF1501 domain-containing protein [Tepidisphaeraceae bacterium]
MTKSFYCDGINRRDFLRVGALTGIGLSLSQYLSLASAGEVAGARANSGIFIRLAGGPSHMDTFDLKPDAPAEFRGEFNPIKTNVPGMEICEHLPELAKVADKYAILRGVSHTLAAHDLGSRYMNTGNKPIPSLTFPCYGSVVAKEKGAAADMPAFVAIPGFGADAAGYLGVEYGPLEVGTSPQKGQDIKIRGLTLNGVTLEEVDRRQNLVKRYDTAFGSLAQEDRLLSGMDEFGQKAYAMMRSDKARLAFSLGKESENISSMFGADPFQQSCLLAARLVESGVKFVTIQLGGWDTHGDNFNALKNKLLPNFDAGLAGLFRALDAKGLHSSTGVFVTGEFGRTPKINARAGRDHYPRSMCCILGGGGIKGGQVVGESDAKAENPKDHPITPDDVAATFYKSLGIDPTKEYRTPGGRPVMLTRYGNVIPDLLV